MRAYTGQNVNTSSFGHLLAARVSYGNGGHMTVRSAVAAPRSARTSKPWEQGNGPAGPCATMADSASRGARTGRQSRTCEMAVFGIRPVRPAGDDAPAVLGHRRRQLGPDMRSVRCRGPGADHRNRAQARVAQVGAAPQPQHDGTGRPQVVKLAGPLRLAGDNPSAGRHTGI
jgi:hypothetical protein